MNRTILTGLAAASLAVGLLAGTIQAQQGKAPYAPYAGVSKDKDAWKAEKDPTVDKMEAQAAKLAQQAKAKPKDAKLKLKVADAYYNAGYTREYKSHMTPKARYRGAMKDYRIALTFNPKHEKAAKELKQIEQIYTTIPGGIPKDL